VTDIFDQATDAEEQERARALAAQAAKTQVPADKWHLYSAVWCEGPGCGERIPDERRRAVPGVKLCVECQGMAERAARRAGGWNRDTST
jgi:phage/conjugal plasmid C-4 type zinc finger TraR family protein